MDGSADALVGTAAADVPGESVVAMPRMLRLSLNTLHPATEGAARLARLRELEQTSRRLRQTQLFIEAPYRNAAMFDALLATLAPRPFVTQQV